jgi:putative sterol carrier protein
MSLPKSLAWEHASGMAHASETDQVLRGRSDDEILAWVHSVGGADATLEEAFWGLKEAFQAERAGGRSAVILWQITTPERELVVYELEVADGECTLSRGATTDPSVVLMLELADFLRLVTGCLDGVDAYRSGRLRIRGDMALAEVLSDWFRERH